MRRSERVALLERDGDVPLSVQADLLSLSRSSLYYHPVPPSPEEIALKHRIDAIYTEFPFYGSRRIIAQLQREEFIVNRKAVQRHMREMGIFGIAPKPNPVSINACEWTGNSDRSCQRGRLRSGGAMR